MISIKRTKQRDLIFALVFILIILISIVFIFVPQLQGLGISILLSFVGGSVGGYACGTLMKRR